MNQRQPEPPPLAWTGARDRSRGPGRPPVSRGRGQAAEAGMPAPAVVEDLHVPEGARRAAVRHGRAGCRGCAGSRRQRPRSPRPVAGRPRGGGPACGATGRGSRLPPRRHGVWTGSWRARRRRSGTLRGDRLLGEKSGGPLEDLVLLLEPPVLAPRARQLGRLHLPADHGPGRARRRVPVPPALGPVGVNAGLGHDPLRGPAALRRRPHRPGFEPARGTTSRPGHGSPGPDRPTSATRPTHRGSSPSGR